MFLAKMQQVLPIAGIEVFLSKASSVTTGGKTQETLTCLIQGVTARGYLTPNGMVVLKDSQAVLEERASAQNYPTVLAQRNELIANDSLLALGGGVYVFQNDVEFSSPSAAAAVIHGGSADGLMAWVNRDGIPIKQLQAA